MFRLTRSRSVMTKFSSLVAGNKQMSTVVGKIVKPAVVVSTESNTSNAVKPAPSPATEDDRLPVAFEDISRAAYRIRDGTTYFVFENWD